MTTQPASAGFVARPPQLTPLPGYPGWYYDQRDGVVMLYHVYPGMTRSWSFSPELWAMLACLVETLAQKNGPDVTSGPGV